MKIQSCLYVRYQCSNFFGLTLVALLAPTQNSETHTMKGFIIQCQLRTASHSSVRAVVVFVQQVIGHGHRCMVYMQYCNCLIPALIWYRYMYRKIRLPPQIHSHRSALELCNVMRHHEIIKEVNCYIPRFICCRISAISFGMFTQLYSQRPTNAYLFCALYLHKSAGLLICLFQ